MIVYSTGRQGAVQPPPKPLWGPSSERKTFVFGQSNMVSPCGQCECKQAAHSLNDKSRHISWNTTVAVIKARWPSECVVGYSGTWSADESSCVLDRKVRHGFSQRVSLKYVFLLIVCIYTLKEIIDENKMWNGDIQISSVHWRFEGEGPQNKSGLLFPPLKRWL